MRKQIVENMWPHGTRVVTKEVTEEISSEMIQKFVRGVALAAKTSGMLEVASPKEIIRALKTIAAQPSDLVRELRKMGKSGSRATQTFRQIRKDL